MMKEQCFLWSTSCLLTKRQKEDSNKKACKSYANRSLAGICTDYIVSKFDNVWVTPCTAKSKLKKFEHILGAEGPGWEPGPKPGPCMVGPPSVNRQTDTKTDRQTRLKTLPSLLHWQAVMRKITHYKGLGLS